MQYFQKARFELVPDPLLGQRIQRTPLGEYLYEAGQLFPLADNYPGCRTFPQTGYQVCFVFLEFFEAYGGENQFGLPISNIELLEDGRRVQYFQEARFEWLPSIGSEQHVELTDLGHLYFDVQGENPAHKRPKPGGDINEGVIELRARAYPEQAVTTANDSQTVHVIVQDQRLLPVAGADVVVNLRMPSGALLTYPIEEPTDGRGVAKITVPVISQSVGAVEIEALVRHEEFNLEAKTVTSFRVWW